MSTRSAIGIEHEDGTVAAVYCHFDGDIAWNGKLLFENYTRTGINALIGVGRGLRSLEPKLSECSFFDDSEVSSFSNRYDYFKSFGHGVEFIYLLGSDNVWVVYDPYEGLTENLEVAINKLESQNK